MTGLGKGRPRLPSATHRLRGTDRPCRSNPEEPQLEAAKLPEPPKDISVDEREVWRELKPIVDGLRIATAADVPAFRALVSAVSMARNLYGADAKEWSSAQKAAMGWMVHFGLTPVARTKVKVLPVAKNEVDPVAEFMQ